MLKRVSDIKKSTESDDLASSHIERLSRFLESQILKMQSQFNSQSDLRYMVDHITDPNFAHWKIMLVYLGGDKFYTYLIHNTPCSLKDIPVIGTQKVELYTKLKLFGQIVKPNMTTEEAFPISIPRIIDSSMGKEIEGKPSPAIRLEANKSSSTPAGLMRIFASETPASIVENKNTESEKSKLENVDMCLDADGQIIFEHNNINFAALFGSGSDSWSLSDSTSSSSAASDSAVQTNVTSMAVPIDCNSSISESTYRRTS